MSISKLRGKSALGRTSENTTASHHATTATSVNGGASKLTKSSYIPQTSLLKIEPFVPSFTTRLRRPIHRSYSTLSSSYFKKTTSSNQLQGRLSKPPNNDGQRQLPSKREKDRTAVQKQRSKSSGSSSSAAVNQTTGAVVTQQPNGVCRIVRSPKEQAKLPDRINYDRRGLGAIPIFENEPNLRLLSLQHNLINVFHIPQQYGDEPCEGATLEKDPTTSTTTTTTANTSKAKLSNIGPMPAQHKRSTSPLVGGSTNTFLNRFTPSPQSGTKLLVQNSIVLNAGVGSAPGGIRKSKSFISNYSKHLSSLKRNFNGRSSMAKVSEGVAQQTQSSLDLTVGESVGDVLNVKNNQLATVYGDIFQHLVFLDLYDNQIEKISNLDGLSNLTVLLLGKNRITDISGLSSLKNTLRVLDLHGNKITSIGNKINCLQELKSLNLAGNQIRQINQNDFAGLLNLRELNLKRNKIKRVHGFNHLTCLERLWLCHNDLHKVEDMSSIAKAINLLEVTIENNPVSLAGDCVSFLVSYLPKLQMLSQMPITEQVRRAAMAWRRNKELSDSSYSTLSSDVFSSIRREEVISNARTNWELLRSQQTVHKTLANAAAEVCPPTIAEEPSPQEAVKLPPIQGQNAKPILSRPPSEKTHSSASSLGPNVDSSSSYFSSDNEDRVTTTHRRKKNGQPAAPKDKGLEKPSVSQPNNKTNEDEPPPPPPPPPPPVEPTKDTDAPSPSSPSSTISAIIQNPSVTIVTQSTAAAINNGSGTSTTLNPEKPSGAGTTATTTTTTTTTTSSKSQQRNPTMSLAINGNNNPASTSNANVTTKRYMHGSLMRSQTTKPTTAAAAAAARASAAQQQQQLSHHNSTANNGVATSGATGNVPGNTGGDGNASSNNNPTNGGMGGVTPSSFTLSLSSCNNGTAFAANKTSTTATTTAANGSNAASGSTKQVADREREQGGDYLIEICGRYLNVYGMGALRFIDKQWNAQKSGDVHTLNFSYINFNSITAVLCRIKVRFPHAEHYVFRETNISCLGQLNALAELQGITSLTIDPEGNAICGKDWRLYAIYRLSHWGLKTINGQEVAESEVEAAQQVYGGLSDLVLWSMPDGMLQPLLARLRLDESCSSSKLTPKEWLLKADDSLKVVVGKEALQWKKTAGGDFDNTATRERGRMHFSLMIENTCNAVEKLQRLKELWPSLLLDMIRNTLLDYSQMEVYLQNLMLEIMK